jgi:hypothetical protein
MPFSDRRISPVFGSLTHSSSQMRTSSAPAETRLPCASAPLGTHGISLRLRMLREQRSFTVTHGQRKTPSTCVGADQPSLARCLPSWSCGFDSPNRVPVACPTASRRCPASRCWRPRLQRRARLCPQVRTLPPPSASAPPRVPRSRHSWWYGLSRTG